MADPGFAMEWDDDEKPFTSSDGSDEVGWPKPLGEAAYYGLPGLITRVISPHTESDPAAILLQGLVCFGNLVGSAAYFLQESTAHHVNEFAVTVGKTSRARKGTSLDNVLRIPRAVDEHWARNRIARGLSSGEGLIEAVRDPNPENPEDKGIQDKRLLVIETELANVLKTCERQGNTVSPRLRDAWDGIDLQTLTRRSNSLRASSPHISMLGHVTVSELRRTLNETERANGFGNRFLWFAVKRSKLLPDGGELPEDQLADLVRFYTEAVDFARRCGRMTRDGKAKALWCEVYSQLTLEKTGMIDAMTARAEAHVLRLSMIYALFDCTSTIGEHHIRAAVEVWRYAEDSIRFIFAGQELGDSIADRVHEALLNEPRGLRRTDINNCVFHGHKSAGEIDAALQSLKSMGLAISVPEKTGGRDAERWFPTRHAEKAGKRLVQ